MPTTKIRTQVKYQKISNDDGYIDAQVCEMKLLQQQYTILIFYCVQF